MKLSKVEKYFKVICSFCFLYAFFICSAIADDIKKISPVWSAELAVADHWSVAGTHYFPDGFILLAGIQLPQTQKTQSDLYMFNGKGLLVKKAQISGLIVRLLTLNAEAVAVVKSFNGEFRFVTLNNKLDVVASKVVFNGDFQLTKVFEEKNGNGYLLIVSRNGIAKIIRLHSDLKMEVIFSGLKNESIADAAFCEVKKLCILKYLEVDKSLGKLGKLELMSMDLDSLNIESKFSINGKKASLDVASSGDMAILYDNGELTKQHIVVQSMDGTLKPKWKLDLLDSPFGIESYKISSYNDEWFVAGNYLNKVALNKISKGGQKISNFVSKDGFPMIMAGLTCRNEFGCFVNTLQIGVDSAMKKTTKLQLLMFNK